MEDSVSTLHTETSPDTDPSSLGSATDAQGLETVPKVLAQKAAISTHNHAIAEPDGADQEIDLNGQENTESANRTVLSDASQHEVNAAEVHTPPPEAPPLPMEDANTDTDPSLKRRSRIRHQPDVHAGKLRKPDRRTITAAEPPSEASSMVKNKQVPKRGGLRNTIRRMFGRSPKDRISMPGPMVYRHHDPHEFITSATEMRTQRSNSVPTNAFLRSSGLGSHPPAQIRPPQRNRSLDHAPPPTGERRPPDRPPRPRSASLPRELARLSARQAINIPRHTPTVSQDEHKIGTENIGFAVTNGGNPRRRSRSADQPAVYKDSDHRMSPIQWRQHRRRSEDTRHFRQSSDLSGFGLSIPEPGEILSRPTRGHDRQDSDQIAQTGNFNFGLSSGAMEEQDRIGLEERLVTMEIKLMDMEYTLSRLQAGPYKTSPRESSSQQGRNVRMSAFSNDSSATGDIPANVGTPSTVQTQSRPPSGRYQARNSIASQNKDRPTSVAATLKAGYNPQNNSFSKLPPELNNHTSGSGLAVDHYAALITLIRREQSARVRLEDQLAVLQKQIDRLAPDQNANSSSASFHRSPNHHRRQYSGSRSLTTTPQASLHTRTFSSNSSATRRHGIIQQDPISHNLSHITGSGLGSGAAYDGSYFRQRSSSYSTLGTTDTEDEPAFHDAYLTPPEMMAANINSTMPERGEYERGAFERVGIPDGAVF